MKIVFILADTPGGEMMALVEVEDDKGNSIDAGSWATHPDGVHQVLVISTDAMINALATRLLELEERNRLEHILATQATPRAWQRLTPDELAFLDAYRQVRKPVVPGETHTYSFSIRDEKPIVTDDKPPYFGEGSLHPERMR